MRVQSLCAVWLVIALGTATPGDAAFSHASGRAMANATFEIGVTHTENEQRTWEKVAGSLPAVESLLSQGVFRWQNLCIPNINTVPGVYKWSEADLAVSLARNTSQNDGQIVVRLFDPPGWMQPDSCNKSPWTKSGCGISRKHWGDFARLAGAVASRYKGVVSHYLVWNEMDGFSRDVNGNLVFDQVNYTLFYNMVYAAVKHADPDAMVGGPYAPISRGQLPPGSSGEVNGSWGTLNPAVPALLRYWLQHAAGADFIAVDGHLAYVVTRGANGTWQHTPSVPSHPEVSAGIFSATNKFIGGLTSLPIWWSEIYPVPCHDYWPGMNWTTAQQVAVYRAGMRAAAQGATLALNWGGMSNDNCVAGMYDSQGVPSPFYTVAKEVNHRQAVP